MQVIGQQWYAENAERSYPLVDGVSRLDTTAAFQLPNDLLVDARIAAPPSYDASAFYVSAVSAFGAGLVLTIGVNGVGDVANVTVPLAGFVEFSSYTLAPLPGHPEVGGTIVFGNAGAIVAAASGSWTFALAATQLLPTVIFPAAPAVTSIAVQDAFGVETRLTGAVVLAAGPNAALSQSGQTISLGIETGVLIEDPCACKDTGGNKRVAVKSINGVTPDSSGNLALVGVGGCMQVTAGTNAVEIADSCAQPCCGAPELQLLEQASALIQQALSQQANRSAELEAVLRQLDNYVTG